MKSGFPDEMRTAAEEYLWMLTRGYPQQSSLKLVGDKFMLPREMRQVLYRGISAADKAGRRQSRLASFTKGSRILVDVYNVLFTINNYLLGKTVFISNDGILRDAGEMRGRIVNKPVFTRSICLMLDVLKLWKQGSFLLYLDAPVSHSGRLSMELSKDMIQMDIEGEAFAVPSADDQLIREDADAICTSDTAIIDRTRANVIDLPRFLLEMYFKPEFPSLLL
jgi:hypothetical protein